MAENIHITRSKQNRASRDKLVVDGRGIPNDTLTLSDVQGINSVTIQKTFGRPEDYIELHIYNSSNELITSNLDFTDYEFPPIVEGTSPENQKTSELLFNPSKILNDLGFTSGKFNIKLNVLRQKIFQSDGYPFQIKEISSTRREIKSSSPNNSNTVLDRAAGVFISEIESSRYFKEFSLNFGNDILTPCINILLNKETLAHELLFKTLDPLSPQLSKQSQFKVVEEIIDPFIFEYDLGIPELEDENIPLMGPNFNVDVRSKQSIPSEYKTYNDILEYNVTSSYNHLLNRLEKTEVPNIEYDYIRPVSESMEDIDRSYHFENFVHFSKAEERLENFKYKIELLELYDSQIDEIGNITGNTSSSINVLSAKKDITDKKQNLIKGLDGYEHFLYYESGAYSWPKTTSTKPYNLFPVTSSEAKTWIGSKNHNDETFYGGQLLSASLYDRDNPHNLSKLIPTHILENTNNTLYIGFVDMIGQHFDSLWTHIKHITEINNHHNKKGISKDLVYFQLKALGIDTFDQFENSNLLEYILGEGIQGTQTYDVTHHYSSSGIASETLVTASNGGSIAKQDITKEVWKRLYHNAPYLLKTKGTERGIKALMSCYGLPHTILNVKEYGGSTSVTGPLKDIQWDEYYKTFTYEKASLALTGSAGASEYLIRADWASHARANDSKNKAITLRIKPERTTHSDAIVLSIGNTITDASGFQLHLEASSSGADIYEVGDNTLYGRLNLKQNGTSRKVSPYFPLYNGEFWNVYIQEDKGNSVNLQFGALQANHLKNIHHIEGESWGGNSFNTTWGGNASSGREYLFAGAYHYTGSIQELRTYWGEVLTEATLKKQALEPFMYAGNTISSSWESLVARYPLGSNDQENLSSHTPNENITARSSTNGVSNTTYVWEEIIENHYLPTPDTVGASTTSEKVRIDSGSVPDNILLHNRSLETSTLDRQPPEYEDLGIFFSPTEEINEDIIYTLGSFRMDDYIGSPLPNAQRSSSYGDLKDIRDVYTRKIKRKYNYWDYIKLIQQTDHTLFKIIEQWVPFKANTKTGLLIEPTYLERSKFAREIPVRSDGQTMTEGLHQHIDFTISSNYVDNKISNIDDTADPNTPQGQYEPGTYVVSDNNLRNVTSSKTGERLERGTNGTIEIYDDYLDPFLRDENFPNNHSAQAPIKPHTGTKSFEYKAHESSVLLGNAIKGRPSSRYYRYKEYNLVTSSLYITPPNI
jgi:hypothetical protein